MMILYHGGGSHEVRLEGPAMSPDEWAILRSQAGRLLKARKSNKAAMLLGKLPFELNNGTNFFADEFTVLHVTVDVERYTRLGELTGDPTYAQAFTQLANTISELGPYVRFIVADLESSDAPAPVAAPSLLISSASVERALEDATLLLRSSSSGPTSAVDRVHTALHGYLRAACERAGVAFDQGDSLAALLKKLRGGHPALAEIGPRPDDIKKVLNAIAVILDVFGPLRNHASIAHANESLLGESEAMLVINCARTVLHYLDGKLA